MEAEERAEPSRQGESHVENEYNYQEPRPVSASPDPDHATVHKPRARGRHAKDPLGVSIPFACQRVEDLEVKLKQYLASPTNAAEHTTLEFSFAVTCAFMVAVRQPVGIKPDRKNTPYVYSAFNKTAVSVVDALQMEDPREQMLTQKGISKTIVEHIQKADGFRYSFHNNWVSKADEASRFSYYCNDSVLNKGRAANAGVQKIRDNVKVRKKVYECEGLISVKFSLKNMSLEVHYRHIPLHRTYEERAPPPRRDSKRRKLMELFEPDKLPPTRERKSKPKTAPPPPKEPRRRTVPHPPVSPQEAVPSSGPPVEASQQQHQQGRQDPNLETTFNFTGSAESMSQQHPPGSTSNHTPNARVQGPSTAPAMPEHSPSKQKQHPFPGMMSGFITSEQVVWGAKADPRAGRAQQTRKPSRDKSAPGPPSASVSAHASAPPPASQPSAPPAPSSTLSEADILRQRLAEAEAKIREMEAERTRMAGMPWANRPEGNSQSPVQYAPHQQQGQQPQPTQPQQQQQQQPQHPPNGYNQPEPSPLFICGPPRNQGFSDSRDPHRSMAPPATPVPHQLPQLYHHTTPATAPTTSDSGGQPPSYGFVPIPDSNAPTPRQTLPNRSSESSRSRGSDRAKARPTSASASASASASGNGQHTESANTMTGRADREQGNGRSLGGIADATAGGNSAAGAQRRTRGDG